MTGRFPAAAQGLSRTPALSRTSVILNRDSGEESREQNTEAAEHGILHFVQDDSIYWVQQTGGNSSPAVLHQTAGDVVWAAPSGSPP